MPYFKQRRRLAFHYSFHTYILSLLNGSHQLVLPRQNQHHPFLPSSFKSSSSTTKTSFLKRSSPPLIPGFHNDDQRNSISVSMSVPRKDVQPSANTTVRDVRNETLYPLPPMKSNGTIRLDSIHTLYYEEYGLNQSDTNVNKTTATKNVKVAKTALSLHGGPGAGSFPNHARFFNPDLYSRIIVYDQRGCGRSTPRGETRFNTLHHLVMDIELLRVHLGVEKWHVVLGGSWGSTLAMAYAQKFPCRVGSIVLRGVCTLRSEEVDWLFGMNSSLFQEVDYQQNGMKHIGQLNQSRWEQFQDAVLHKSNGDSYREFNRKVLHKYYDCLLGENTLLRAHAATAWFRWEMGVSSLSMPDWDDEVKTDIGAHLLVWKPSSGWLFQVMNNITSGQSTPNGLLASDAILKLRRWSQNNELSADAGIVRDLPTSSTSCREIQYVDWPSNLSNETTSRLPKGFMPVQAMLTCFYSVNNEFMMSDFQLLSRSRIEKISHIPCIAIQGGHDLICPPDTALDLHEVWPEMELRIVLNGKHSMYDPSIAAELVKATNKMGTL